MKSAPITWSVTVSAAEVGFVQRMMIRAIGPMRNPAIVLFRMLCPVSFPATAQIPDQIRANANIHICCLPASVIAGCSLFYRGGTCL